MIPRTLAWSCGLLNIASALRRQKRTSLFSSKCLQDAASVWKEKGEPHPPSLFNSPCHLPVSFNPRTSTRITSGCGCRGLESISGNRDCVIELHDTLAWPVSTRLCTHTRTQSCLFSGPHPHSPASRHAKAGPSRWDLITLTSPPNYMCNENPPQSPREFQGPSPVTAKQTRTQAP